MSQEAPLPSAPTVAFGPAARRVSVPVTIGKVAMGGLNPVVVQSMTNTDTADVDGTVEQIHALAQAGSEIVRVTVDTERAAAAVPHIKEKLLEAETELTSTNSFDGWQK